VTILAGDIGGTKTLLQLVEPGGHGLQVCYQQRFNSADFPHFEDILQIFMDAAGKQCAPPDAACFGVAGPVNERRARTTNLPWTLDAEQIEARFNISRVALINDFQAVGYGIEMLEENDLVTLQTGEEVKQGNRVIIGAGTGLGHGLLVWQQDGYQVVASEGGHASFAPTDELQIELLQYLAKRSGPVSWERVVSGPGLVTLFEFMLETGKGKESPALHEARRHQDPAAAISRFALSGDDPLAVQTLDLFSRLYGAQAGNLALIGLATGGVYVAGGVAPQIIGKLQDGSFMAGFMHKEASMRHLLRAMPVQVVVNPHVGLLGATTSAARLSQGS
jgi:glucokinase